MTSLLFNIRRKILGKNLAEKCEKGLVLSEQEIQSVINNFRDGNTYLLSHDDIINICSLKTSDQINKVKQKILGDTEMYCEEKNGGLPIPLDDVAYYKRNKLQKLFTNTEFIHICKTTGWYEQAVNIMYDIITNGNVQASKKKIIFRLNKKIMSINKEIRNQTKNNEDFKNLNMVVGSFTFYSSTPFDMEEDDFELMRVVWCSPEVSQSMLYMLETEKVLTQPVMFSFNFNRDMLVLNATDFENESIFDDVLDKDTINRLKNAYKFDFGNNVLILCVIEAINRLTQESHRLKIYGYRNRYDQNELALINFNNVVDRDSIRKAIFDKVILENLGVQEKLVLNFPFNNKSLYEMYLLKRYALGLDPRIKDYNKENFRIIKTLELGQTVYRASCPDIDLKVLYHYEDDETAKLTFNCSNENKDDTIEEDMLYVEVV